MPTGSSPLYRLKKQDPQPLQLDNSYFLLNLHAAQAYFTASWLARPGFLTISSTVESSFQPNQTIRNLHQVTTLKKNVPCQVGYSANLTDWLPALRTSSVQVTLQYTVTRDTPFKTLVDQMEKVNLISKVSLVRPELGVAAKVSEITGNLLSYLLQEGESDSIFSLTMELNLKDLEGGYYAVVGSPENVRWPSEIWLDSQGHLVGDNYLLDKLSYAVIKLSVLPRKGEETARGEPWWELLQAAKDQILFASPDNDKEVQQLLVEWKQILRQVNELSRKERSYLLREIREIIQEAHSTVDQSIQPVGLEAVAELPQDLQTVLGVRTQHELYSTVRDYKDALDVSTQLLEQYASE